MLWIDSPSEILRNQTAWYSLRHESFYTLGAYHESIGDNGAKLNKQVVGAVLLFTSKNSRKLKVKLQNQYSGFLTKSYGKRLQRLGMGKAKTHLLKVKVHNKNKVKLNGTY